MAFTAPLLFFEIHPPRRRLAKNFEISRTRSAMAAGAKPHNGRAFLPPLAVISLVSVKPLYSTVSPVSSPSAGNAIGLDRVKQKGEDRKTLGGYLRWSKK
jgi:hypothetical protein